MKKIVDAMARAMYVSGWANREEEACRSHGGEELMDIAPKTSRRTQDKGWLLCGMFEQANGCSIITLFLRAMIADGLIPDFNWESEEFERLYDQYAKEFGHYLAMRAMGTGVAWEDDHKSFEIEYPHYEYYG